MALKVIGSWLERIGTPGTTAYSVSGMVITTAAVVFMDGKNRALYNKSFSWWDMFWAVCIADLFGAILGPYWLPVFGVMALGDRIGLKQRQALLAEGVAAERIKEIFG
jgi:hypothetical protein